MPDLVSATWPASVLAADDWEAYERDMEDFGQILEEELDARRAEELEEIDYEYNRVYWRDEIEDEFLPF